MNKQETLEEAAYQRAVDRNWNPNSLETRRVGNEIIEAVKFGAKWMQERMYSEEDMKQFGLYLGDNLKKLKSKTIDEIFEQFKKKV